MYPGSYAALTPDRDAVINASTGERLTYGGLEDRSIRMAAVLRAAGLARGDVVALVASNDTRFFEVYWACLRSGLYLTPVNTHLAASEIAYIVNDCDAKALIVSADLEALLLEAVTLIPAMKVQLAFGGRVAGFDDYESVLEVADPVAPADQPRGADMLYSSGTTGRPKGVKPPLPDRQVGDPGDPYVAVFGGSYSFSDSSVYFSPAPLYHAAPLRFGMVTLSRGGTVITTGRFDAAQSLRVIGDYGVTHSQWVPTHFIRLLRLPAEVRAAADTSSQTHVIHAAAPCPVEVKQQMMNWWGPILYEYYASTEANGVTMVNPREWLEKPGTVGQAKLGVVHVCDDQGRELPTGEIGLVWFEREAMPFSYHGDPVKTAAAQHPDHPTWSTCGDVGRLDGEGYLYLTDRKSFTIISGGVNIYPQEIEDALVMHDDVFDVAVVGIPDPEFGESVLAVVQVAAGVTRDDATRERLLTFLRSRIAGYKLPRRLEFTDGLPRTETGKLLKRSVQDIYSQKAVA